MHCVYVSGTVWCGAWRPCCRGPLPELAALSAGVFRSQLRPAGALPCWPPSLAPPQHAPKAARANGRQITPAKPLQRTHTELIFIPQWLHCSSLPFQHLASSSAQTAGVRPQTGVVSASHSHFCFFYYKHSFPFPTGTTYSRKHFFFSKQ